MKKIFYFATLALLTNICQAQSPLWTKADTASRRGTITTNKYVQDSSGNHYYTGTISGTARFGPYSFSATGSQDAFVLKLESTGKVAWAKHYKGQFQVQGTDITVDTAGNVYVTGMFSRDIIIGKDTVKTGGSNDGYLIKLKKDGTNDWYKTATGTSIQQGMAVEVKTDGAVYWAGNYINSSTIAGKSVSSSGFSYDCYLARITSAGHTSWVKSFGGSSIDQITDIDFDDKKNLLLTGNFFGTITFGTKSISGSGGYDIFVASYDTAGKYQWAISCGGTSTDQSTSIAWDDKGGFVLGGIFNTSASFGGKTLSGSFNDLFVARFNNKVKGVYAVKIPRSGFGFGNNNIKQVLVDSKGGVLVAGNFSTALSINSKTITPAGGFDAFVLRITNKGLIEWINPAGGSSTEQVSGLFESPKGFYYIGGIFSSKCKFGSNITLNGLGSNTVFYAEGLPPITAPDFKGRKTVFVYADSLLTRNFDLKIKAETTYELLKAPSGLTFDSTKVTVAWTPKTSDYGKHEVHIRAENLAGVDTSDILIWVIDKPNATINTPDTVCFGQETTISFTASNAGPQSTHWKFSDGSEFVRNSVDYTFKDTGVQVVGLEVQNFFGDTAYVTKPVYVISHPKAGFSYMNACLNDTIVLTDTSTTSQGGITDYKWYENQQLVSTSNFFKSKKTSRDTFRYKLMVTGLGGCKDSAFKTIRITAKPDAKFVSFNTCVREDALFFDQSTTDGDTIVRYQWDFGDGTKVSVKYSGYAHMYQSSGKFTPSLTVTTSNNCVDKVSYPLSVYSKPVPQFALSDVCGDSPVELDDISDAKEGNISARIWDFGDGKFSSKKKVSHKYPLAGTYTISLAVTNSKGCSDTLYKDVAVYPTPNPKITSGNLCANALTKLESSAKVGATDSIVSYEWQVDGSVSGTNSDLKYQFADASITYSVQLKLETRAGCIDSVETKINSLPFESSKFSMPKTCIGDTADLTVGFDTANLDTFYWVPLGAKIHEDGGVWKAHLVPQANHHLFLRTIGKNGCEDSSFAFLPTFPQPESDFSSLNLGDKKVQFTADDLTETGYKWDFGDGNSGISSLETHTYADFGTYNVSLEVWNDDGCSYTTTKEVEVSLTVGTPNISANAIQVFPNPTNGVFTLNIGDETNMRLEIISVAGQSLESQMVSGSATIDVSHLAKGAYILHLWNDSRQEHMRLVLK